MTRPYWLAFDKVATLTAGAAPTTLSEIVQTGIEFIVQCLLAYGTPASGALYRNFTLSFRGPDPWMNEPVLADLIAGDGRNNGVLWSEHAVPGGTTIYCDIKNASATVSMTDVYVVLGGYARYGE